MNCLGRDSTRDVLGARRTLYQLSHRGSSTGQAESCVSPLMNRVTNLSIKIGVHVHVGGDVHYMLSTHAYVYMYFSSYSCN